jgi:hypothetical protein
VAGRAAEWRRLKALLLDSVSLLITKRVYNLGLNEFIAWYTEEPRPLGFTKATVSGWRVALEARGLGPDDVTRAALTMEGQIAADCTGLRHQNVGRFQVAMGVPLPCAASSAAATPSTSRTASVGARGACGGAPSIVQRADVGMVEGGHRWRFAKEAVGKLVRAELDRTSRRNRVSHAFHTSPMPPLPMAETSSYGPNLSPCFRSMGTAGLLQSTI